MGVSAESIRGSSCGAGGRGDVQTDQDQLWGAAGFLVVTGWATRVVVGGGRARDGGMGQGPLHKNCGFCPKGAMGI